MDDATPSELVIVPDPTVKLMPLVLGMAAAIGVAMASAIPGIGLLLRLAAAGSIIGILSHWYLTAVRRLVVGDDAVDIELSRKRARIPYSNLDHVTVRAMPLGGTLNVVFVTRNPPASITTHTGLMYDEVLEIAPKLIRALIIHGVEVRVPGRPDLSAR